MRPLSPVLASLAKVFRVPISRPTPTMTASIRGMSCTSIALPSTDSRSFSTTTALLKKGKKGAHKIDKRITLIRYFLYHPLTPRPLRFSRGRYLRHWTIHRAWHLYQAQLRHARTLELQKQYQSMRDACEELRTGIGDGGRLFRISMNKRGVFTDLFPIEYGRLQTDMPSKDGWNHEWKRA
jgi:large subunit ribosomal protein L40